MAWKVYWDNGTEACGTFPDEYETEEQAQWAADDWAAEMNAACGIDPEDPEACSAEPIWVEPSAASADQHDQYCNCDACKRTWGETA